MSRACALAGTDTDAPDLAQLVRELLLKSPDFARLWERYDVKGRTQGRKTFHHPEVATSPSATSPCSWTPPPPRSESPVFGNGIIRRDRILTAPNIS
ncbi:MmyB family transcriptional regulator [Streptomyces sp. LARHCF252]